MNIDLNSPVKFSISFQKQNLTMKHILPHIFSNITVCRNYVEKIINNLKKQNIRSFRCEFIILNQNLKIPYSCSF